MSQNQPSPVIGTAARKLPVAAVTPAPTPIRPPPAAEQARMRRLVLTSQFYQDVVAGNDNFLVRPIMNILGKELRPVSTRARAQGGAGGLLWAFFPGSISSDIHLLRSCPYGDPGDQLLIVTPDSKDLPLTVTVLESYPHRVLATSDKFLQGLVPSQWARLGSVQNFFEHWERSFGHVFKLTHEPWAWVVQFRLLTKPVIEGQLESDGKTIPEPPSKPRSRPGLFWRWRQRLKAPEPTNTLPQTRSQTLPVPVVPNPHHQQLLVAQHNALACLENAIRAEREGRTEEGWRLMKVAYRILNRVSQEPEAD